MLADYLEVLDANDSITEVVIILEGAGWGNYFFRAARARQMSSQEISNGLRAMVARRNPRLQEALEDGCMSIFINEQKQAFRYLLASVANAA